MKRYWQIIWDNLFVKTFNYKEKTSRKEFIICNIFWWICFLIPFSLCCIEEDICIIFIPHFILLIYLRIIPFQALRVRRLHDIGEAGSRLIWIYLITLPLPFFGLIWLVWHMYDSGTKNSAEVAVANTAKPNSYNILIENNNQN